MSAGKPAASHVLHRALHHDYPVAVRGSGIRITDETGKDYIDASGGAAVSCLGHGHPDVLAAMHAQLDQLAYAHTSFFTTRAAEQLADTLIAGAPPGISKVYFCSSGSEAIEACLKLARHYFVETGQTERSKFISRRQAYHGITLGALSAGGRMPARAPFAEMLFPVHHVAPCYEYRDRRATRPRKTTAPASPPSSMPRSASSAHTPLPPSSPRPWSAPRWAPPPPYPATSSASARCATATACC